MFENNLRMFKFYTKFSKFTRFGRFFESQFPFFNGCGSNFKFTIAKFSKNSFRITK